MPDNKSSIVRDRLVQALRTELMGPSEPEEIIKEYPTARYTVGRLAPANDPEAAIPPTENDSLGAGSVDDESGNEEDPPPLIIGFNPSSMGLSFLIDQSTRSLRVQVSWGDYKRGIDGATWQRCPRNAVVDGVPVETRGTIPRIVLSPSGSNPAGVVVTGVDDPEIALEGVVHDFAGYRAVSLFLVNRRTKGALGDRSKDERWIYQPKLVVTTSDSRPVFVAKDFRTDSSLASDGETATNELLYWHAREFATGHGIAVGWNEPVEEGRRTTSVFTEFVPTHEIPVLIAPADQTGGATLDMKVLSSAGSPEQLTALLGPMLQAYERWVASTRQTSQTSEYIRGDPNLQAAADENLRRCDQCVARIRAGLELLHKDRSVFEAFRFANAVMWDQRIHSLWAARNRAQGKITGSPSEFDTPENRTWRPFQIGFILLNLCGIADEASADRHTVDLLWFPTGGGKTEAYLGLAAFTLALRRLGGDRYGMHGGAGVSIIMRYTLRLLTVQQFQRAAALIAACEVKRRAARERWGTEPFRIGVWVGRGTTPNVFADSQKAIEDLREGRKPREGSPIQLVTCPWCGAALVNEKGIPEKGTYVPDPARQRTLIWCPNEGCDFSAQLSRQDGLPVVVVDDELYRACPSLVVATVDKFARLPFKGESRALFGLRNRFSPTYGHLSAAHGDSVGGRKIRDANPAPRLLPPELVIQDELHLISGPLGTMVGLYEAAVDYATSLKEAGSRIPSKVVASTATIRRAEQQIRQLYARKLQIFPPAGITSRDSFFARERPIDRADDTTAGRLYVGVNAPGSSTKTLLVRVYSILLAAAEAETRKEPATADPYGTLVGYSTVFVL
jgi:hypothetical protein